MNAFFIGIGGMGMSGIALILHQRGFKVAGSDRNVNGEYCAKLKKQGIKIYSQDGKGIEDFIEANELDTRALVVVKSTAIEDTVPDVIVSNKLRIKQIMRSDLLAELFNKRKGIAIAGTAGKTTTTGLLAWIMKYSGKDPSFSLGGLISDLDTNAFDGDGENFVIEADESDGSIVKYKPELSALTSISKDHKSVEELSSLFEKFFNNTTGKKIACISDSGSNNFIKEYSGDVLTYGINNSLAHYNATDVEYTNSGASFLMNKTRFSVPLAGEHNVLNSVCALALADLAGVDLSIASSALEKFPGMKRRFEIVGEAGGVTVIDDFAHNPTEIAAAIKTARKTSDRRFYVYQPHGYGPTRFTLDELVKVLGSIDSNEHLFLDEIFYAGGTVKKDISSYEIAKLVREKNENVTFCDDRQKIIDRISSQAKRGDLVLVMGARDINKICTPILNMLAKKTN